MKNLVVLGEGPLLKVAMEYAQHMGKWNNISSLSFNANKKGIDITSYVPSNDDEFVCSFYDIPNRMNAVKAIENKDGKFTNIIHPTANILSTATLGLGNIIGAFVTISTDVTIKNHVFIQDHCNIGHDSIIEDYCHIFVGCTLCGINMIGAESMLFTRSIIYPKVKVGVGSVVSAASVVLRKVKDGETVMGNPATKVEL